MRIHGFAQKDVTKKSPRRVLLISFVINFPSDMYLIRDLTEPDIETLK